MIARLAGEMAYVESLRDRFLGARRILHHIRQLRTPTRNTQKLVEESRRIAALLKRPVDKITQRFEELDANIGEIYPTLRELPNRIEYIRKLRDEMRASYLLWQDILAAWEAFDPEDEELIAGLLSQTYKFAAHYFPQVSKW